MSVVLPAPRSSRSRFRTRGSRTFPTTPRSRRRIGALGPGALYFLNTRDTSQGEPFLKQGFLTLRRRGFTAKLGRFEYRDGARDGSADATLAFLKRTRIAERLVGPFDFTHVTRSFDGGLLAYDRPGWNATAIGLRPTQGGFEISANRELDGIDARGFGAHREASARARRRPIVRLFYLYYEDGRDEPLKVDNRPLAARRRDQDRSSIHTIGGHAITAFDAGPGHLDGLVWAVAQTGDWGVLDHARGLMPSRPATSSRVSRPRRGSGSGTIARRATAIPTDGDHGTFFQILPTARVYAQLPFFNLMNNQDVFAQLILRPHARVTIRTDYHWLRSPTGTTSGTRAAAPPTTTSSATQVRPREGTVSSPTWSICH